MPEATADVKGEHVSGFYLHKGAGDVGKKIQYTRAQSPDAFHARRVTPPKITAAAPSRRAYARLVRLHAALAHDEQHVGFSCP